MTQLTPGDYDAVINGTRLHYSVRGRGPALIAHSGGPGWDARSWDDFAGIDAFVTVIALHPRGSGLSDTPANNAFALADYAADVEALRKHLGLEKPMVMGWSHGGMVAQQFASRFPDALSKLILFSTTAWFGNSLSDPQRTLTAIMAHQQQPWFGESLAALRDWWAGKYTTNEEAAELRARVEKFHFRAIDARAEEYLQRAAQLPMNIAPLLTFMGSEAATMDLRPDLKSIRVPTLVVAGRHDIVTPVAMSEDIARRVPGAQLVICERSGHFAHIEEPGRFCQLIRQFVRGEA